MHSDIYNESQSHQNIAFIWACKALSTSVQSGLKYAVISPGSRSTPLALAAALHPGINDIVVLDERSAAFIALGIAKATGFPAALICTSGTAAANYYPAVIEARESAVPMIIMSADRPAVLRNTGANQTIDQEYLFGKFAGFYSISLPSYDVNKVTELKNCIAKGIHHSFYNRVPVQFNFPFEKPLEPANSCMEQYRQLFKNKDDSTGPEPTINLVSELQDDIIKLLQTTQKPLLLGGLFQPFDPLTLTVLQVAGKLNSPILAEASSQWYGGAHPDRFIYGYDAFLRHPEVCKQLKPDLIISAGDAWISKGLETYLRHHSGIPHIHFSSTGLPNDPFGTVNHTAEVVSYRINWPKIATRADDSWLHSWQAYSKNCKGRTANWVKETGSFTDWHVFQSLLFTIPSGHNFFIGNSLCIRDFNFLAEAPSIHHTIFANRGVSGIDGNISTAIGTAMATGKPTVAVTGDLTFLHDTNALLSLRLVKTPFTIIVINNGGGAIFDMLPITTHHSLMDTYFRTPQTADFKTLAQTYGLNFYRAERKTELNKLLQNSKVDTPCIIECKTDARSSMALRNNVWNHPWYENLT